MCLKACKPEFSYIVKVIVKGFPVLAIIGSKSLLNPIPLLVNPPHPPELPENSKS